MLASKFKYLENKMALFLLLIRAVFIVLDSLLAGDVFLRPKENSCYGYEDKCD